MTAAIMFAMSLALIWLLVAYWILPDDPQLQGTGVVGRLLPLVVCVELVTVLPLVVLANISAARADRPDSSRLVLARRLATTAIMTAVVCVLCCAGLGIVQAGDSIAGLIGFLPMSAMFALIAWALCRGVKLADRVVDWRRPR